MTVSGGCRSQGCHGYPSRSARSYSRPHLPCFRHHSPSLTIVMSLTIIAKNTGLSDFEINYKADVPGGLMRRLSVQIFKLFVKIEIGTCS